MWVRSDPLILGKEFAEEGGGTVSHPDGQPGGAGSMFIPQLACQADLPGLSIWPDVQIRFGMAQGIEFGAKSVFPAQELFLAEQFAAFACDLCYAYTVRPPARLFFAHQSEQFLVGRRTVLGGPNTGSGRY